MFHPTQAFNMIDQNRDGFIDHEDLKDMLASLGELIGTLMVMISTEACFHNEIICGLFPPSLPSSSFLLPPFLPHSLPLSLLSHRSGTQ